MGAVQIQRDDPSAPAVVELLAAHLAFAREVTPPEDVYALDVEGLRAEDIQLFSARVEGRVVAVGALRRLDQEHAEIKSMHTASWARGQGHGRAVLEHLLQVARAAGHRRVSLETGAMEAFAPARALYQRFGFEVCAPFGDYPATAGSVCMTLVLE